MAQALKLCPQAVVLNPDIARYERASAAIRTIFRNLTPLVEPVSLDEAYLDLSGTAALHGRAPAVVLADAARRIEREVGVSASIGLSHAMFLAKIASDLDKPRGFAVIARLDTDAFLRPKPVSILPGVGAKTAERLRRMGFATVGDLARVPVSELVGRLGAHGAELALLSRGQSSRRVVAEQEAKSISAETTFDVDLRSLDNLRHELWPLCERVSHRLKDDGAAGSTVVLKLKTARFVLRTRQVHLADPTQLAETLWRALYPVSWP